MADNNEILFTKEGLTKLQKEYDELVNIQKPRLLQDLANARSLGDLSENAAYSEARRRQSFIEGRIAELFEILKNAKVMKKEKSDKVQLGSKIKVHLDGQEEEFLIVSSDEADLSAGKISQDSPLGKALFGRAIGDQVKVEAPIGKVEYTILAVD